MENSRLDHEILTPEEAAAYLKVSRYTVLRWCRQGRLPAFQIGRGWRVRKERLDQLIQQLETEAVDPPCGEAISTPR